MKYLMITSFFMITLVTGMDAQITGKWKSTDHLDHVEKSIVNIYESNGKFYGKVEKLLPAATITHCTGCEGELKDKSIIGMVIIRDLTKKENEGTGGKILDPSNGKWYSCDIELASPDKLKVTGYIGLPMLGKTMYWQRVK